MAGSGYCRCGPSRLFETPGRSGRSPAHKSNHEWRGPFPASSALFSTLRLCADRLSRGRRCGLLPVLLNPLWRFVRGYLLRLGFADGWRGLVFALIEANYVRGLRKETAEAIVAARPLKSITDLALRVTGMRKDELRMLADLAPRTTALRSSEAQEKQA